MKTVPIYYPLGMIAMAAAICTMQNSHSTLESRLKKEKEFSRSWETNYVQMKAAFDLMRDANQRLEFQVLYYKTNFQSLIDSISGFKREKQ